MGCAYMNSFAMEARMPNSVENFKRQGDEKALVEVTSIDGVKPKLENSSS